MSAGGAASLHDLDSNTDMTILPTEHLLPTCLLEEEGELSDREAGPTIQEPDQLLSSEQTYQETVRDGTKSEFEASLSADDNLLAGPRSQPTSKFSVKLPTDKWLCQKLEKVNITLV